MFSYFPFFFRSSTSENRDILLYLELKKIENFTQKKVRSVNEKQIQKVNLCDYNLTNIFFFYISCKKVFSLAKENLL